MQNENISTKVNKSIIRDILFVLTVASLFLSAIYATSRILSVADGKVRADFTLMLSQCSLGIVGMILPSLAKRYLHFRIPDGVTAIYFAFIYCAIFLGEVLEFYYVVPFWDSALHAASSAMLTVVGASIAIRLCADNATRGQTNPILICLFAIGFAITVGVLWEIYEFSFDTILGLNMQKFRTFDGDMLVGKAALFDTMKDLVVDSAVAFITSFTLYIKIRKERKNGYKRSKKAE